MNICAVPAGGHSLMLDCDECGPLGIIERPLIHTYAYAHLAAHGIEVPMDEPCCTCGYNYAHPTGHPDDKAVCTECGWAGAGEFADHQAHHHFLDTRHYWALEMGGRT